jgi:hypothetical protein
MKVEGESPLTACIAPSIFATSRARAHWAISQVSRIIGRLGETHKEGEKTGRKERGSAAGARTEARGPRVHEQHSARRLEQPGPRCRCTSMQAPMTASEQSSDVRVFPPSCHLSIHRPPQARSCAGRPELFARLPGRTSRWRVAGRETSSHQDASHHVAHHVAYHVAYQGAYHVAYQGASFEGGAMMKGTTCSLASKLAR